MTKAEESTDDDLEKETETIFKDEEKIPVRTNKWEIFPTETPSKFQPSLPKVSIESEESYIEKKQNTLLTKKTQLDMVSPLELRL